MDIYVSLCICEGHFEAKCGVVGEARGQEPSVFVELGRALAWGSLGFASRSIGRSCSVLRFVYGPNHRLMSCLGFDFVQV